MAFEAGQEFVGENLSRVEVAKILLDRSSNRRFRRHSWGLDKKGRIWVRGGFPPAGKNAVDVAGFLCSTVLPEIGYFMLTGVQVTEVDGKPAPEPLFILSSTVEVDLKYRQMILTQPQLDGVIEEKCGKSRAEMKPFPKMEIFRFPNDS